MILPRISTVWTAENSYISFVELLGEFNGEYAYHVCVWTNAGYVYVIDI